LIIDANRPLRPRGAAFPFTISTKAAAIPNSDDLRLDPFAVRHLALGDHDVGLYSRRAPLSAPRKQAAGLVAVPVAPRIAFNRLHVF